MTSFSADLPATPFSDGWVTTALRRPSANFDVRPDGCTPDLLVIHAISLPSGQFSATYIDDLFLNQLDLTAHPSFAQLEGVRVSAHFLIRRDGTLVQYVSTDQRAWHAGVSEFLGRARCNDFSIGVELEGSDAVPFELPQYATLVELTATLLQHYPLQHVAGHEDIAPGRKTDPGPFFDWQLYQHSLNLHLPLVPANSAIRFRATR